MVKTVILDGSELKVSGPDGDNAEIHNFGTGTIYVSKFPDIAADADNVIAVSSGAIDGLSGTGGTVYLLGTGKVQVNFTDEKITRTSVSYAAGNGSGVMQEYVDEKDAETLSAAKDYADTVGADLSGYIGYTANDIYGLEADFENNKFIRLAGAVGKTAGADFDNVRAYGGRRRCNLSDDGEVLAYYGDENFKADGSNGQVMVEQPRFYYKVVPLKTEKIDGADGYHLRKARYYISDTPKAGFKVHPAFVRNGVEVDRIYLSAFEGCIYDTSNGEYLSASEQSADFDNDMLSSIAGIKPCSKFTRNEARKLAHNRGNGWEQANIQTVSATQLLFVIEHASFNSQTEIGIGVSSKADNKATNMSESTGKTLALGNTSGSVTDQHITYRGEENIYGNIQSWVDGLIIKHYPNKPNLSLFISDTYTSDSLNQGSYKVTDIIPEKTDAYVSAFGYSKTYDWIFFPTETKGTDVLPIGDRYYGPSIAGEYVLGFGGDWYHGTGCGCFCWYGFYTSEIRSRIMGSRLSYFPT